MVKDDKYYRDKLKEDVIFIMEHMAGQTPDSFEADPVLQDSMMFRLIQISESARNLSDEFKSSYAGIPWNAVYGLRNRIVHDYGNVSFTIVYNTLKYDISDLYDILKII